MSHRHLLERVTILEQCCKDLRADTKRQKEIIEHKTLTIARLIEDMERATQHINEIKQTTPAYSGPVTKVDDVSDYM